VNATAGLGRSLMRGVLWSGLNTSILRLGQFMMSVVIARLVSPREFGVFIVAVTVYLIIINVSEIGVSTALVREVDNADRIAPTVSTIAIVNSALLAAGMYLAAPVLASALGAPAAAGAVRVLAIPLLLAGPTAVPAALLARDFLQGRKLITDLTNFIVANGLLLILALRGEGVMALAWSRAAGQAASAVLLYLVSAKRYWPGFDRHEARRLLRFGIPLAGANLAGFTLGNVDFITVGKLAGPLQLGYYNLAFSVSSWPSSVFTTILSSVTLPALARVKGGMAEVGRHVAAALSALCAAAFPVAVLCLVLAHPLVTVVYGARWAPSAQALVILAVFGAVRVIIALFSDLIVAVDRTRQLFQLQLVWLAALVPSIIGLVYLGKSTGAAAAQVLVAVCVVIPAYLLVLARSVGLRLRILLVPVGRPLLAAAFAGAASWLAAALVSPPLGKLGTGIAGFGVVYILFLGRWPLRLKRELTSLYGRQPQPAPHVSHRMARGRKSGRHRGVHQARRSAPAMLVRKAHVPAPVPGIAMGRWPRVSVIIPCFNYGHFLPQSVGSALSQEGVQPEVVIVDDASTDDSADIAGAFAREDRRVTVVRHRYNTGHVRAFNDGLEAATGEFIVRLDADDLLTPGSLARSVALFDAFPAVGLVYGHPRHFATTGPPAARAAIRGWSIWSGSDWIAERCRKGVNCITTPEAMIRADVMRSVGGLDTTLRFAQDMEMWLRTAAVSDVGRVDGPDQAFHRDHPASMSVTEGAGRLVDLRERAAVFDVLFAGPGGRLNDAFELHRAARRALAAEALTSAYHAYDRRRTGTEEIGCYVEFALATFPAARKLPQWRALQKRQRVGARFAPVVPTFTASAIWRRFRWESEHRRWQRTGL